ncbi:MAG: FecR domain-containing protein [Dongiaceae bacterium]
MLDGPWGIRLVLAAIGLCTLVRGAAAVEDIGRAEIVIESVRGTLDGRERRLDARDPVFRDEEIETGTTSASEIRLRDDTQLTIGPSSRVVLDDFVLDADASRQRLVIALGRGVLRFVTGTLAKSAYEIRTPTAVIGVRGTVFTVSVDEDGTTRVRVEDGGVEAANLAGVAVEVEAGFSTVIAGAAGGMPPPPGPPAPLDGAAAPEIGRMDELIAAAAGEAPGKPLRDANDPGQRDSVDPKRDKNGVKPGAN